MVLEAFCIQLEGQKRWRVYEPRNAQETLPRESSQNFKQDEIGEPVIDVVLKPGDLLYFPRGWIHQAVSPEGEHSLHLTVSTALHNNWVDLLQFALPQALQHAAEGEVDLRKSLPRDLLQFAGIVNSNPEDHETAVIQARGDFKQEAKTLAKLVLKYLPGVLDGAADQVGRELMHAKMPPPLTTSEEAQHFKDGSEGDLTPESRVRLVRRDAARLIPNDEGEVVLYHCVQNPRAYHTEEAKGIVFDLDQAAGVEFVLAAYPDSVLVSQLPLADLQDRLDICLTLYEQGVVLLVPDE